MKKTFEFTGEEFFEMLMKISDNGEYMRKLRTGLCATSDIAIFESDTVLWKIGVHEGVSDWLFEVCRYVGGFFAVHPFNTSEDVSFGLTLASYAIKSDASLNGLSNEINFVLMSERIVAMVQLEKLVRKIENIGIPINYTKLFDDLKYWGRKYNARNSVQNQWGRDFYCNVPSVF